MIEADLGKEWICQATINMADDEELLRLARKAGCIGAFIGFESTSEEGLAEVGKKYNLKGRRDFKASVHRIQRHGIAVAGSFIMGLDIDRPGIGLEIAETADRYDVDFLNVLIMTPLPGTALWKKMEDEGRITADRFPEDWKYYTLTIPVARYKHLGSHEIIDELNSCTGRFYSIRRIIRRVGRNLRWGRHPFLVMAGNLSYRNNGRLGHGIYEEFKRACTQMKPAIQMPATGDNLHAKTGIQ
jgi:radical SAM superfamily enzyme YgiQ (UPF0313 family)